jgi:transcriptional regulator GlxA family with amidase domain
MLQRARVDRIQRFRLGLARHLLLEEKLSMPEISVSGSG